MKKLLSVILVLVLTVSCFMGLDIVSASTASVLEIELPEKLYSYNSNTKVVTPTKYFDVKVNLTENTGIAGVQFDVVFDNSLLALKTVTGGSVLSDCHYNSSLASPCTVMVYNSNTEATNETGTIVTLNFGVRSTVNNADLKFEIKNIVAFDEDTEEIDVTCSPVTKNWCSHASQNWEYIEDKDGNYSGEAAYRCASCDTSFETQRVTMPSLTEVKWEIPTQFYTGSAITPTIKGEYYSENFKCTLTLQKNVNFKIASIGDNKKVGTAYVNLTSAGCKGYRGAKNNLEFKIVKPSVTLSSTSVEYNGKSRCPTPTVKVGKTTLVKDTDYTVSYKDNKYPGKATVLIKGKGKYEGTYKVYFRINPKAPKLKTYKSSSKKKLTVAVSKTSLVSGYQFQVARNSKFTTGKKTYTSTSYKTYKTTFSSLSSKKYYYVRVRSYKKVGSSKYYGKWCSVKKVKVK